MILKLDHGIKKLESKIEILENATSNPELEKKELIHLNYKIKKKSEKITGYKRSIDVITRNMEYYTVEKIKEKSQEFICVLHSE